jgi:small nuclear ribonucleoprotein G
MAPKYQKGPDLKRFMDKRLKFCLNGNRVVEGTLRGFDAFLNVVLEEATTNTNDQDEQLGTVVLRGNSIVQFEGLERVSA